MRLYLKGKKGKFNAVAEYENKKFVILKNSTISQKLSENKLISKRVISYRNDKNYVKNYKVIKDITFKSPSLAAQFVLGYIMNGKRVWKDESGKKILDMKEK